MTILSLLSSGAVGGIFGGIIVALINHHLAQRREKRQHFEEACKQFRKAFADEIWRLRHQVLEKENGVQKLLEVALPKHASAVIEFEQFLPPADKLLFQMAWAKYLSGDHPIRYPFLERFADLGSFEKERHARSEALRLLENLIEYAKVK